MPSLASGVATIPRLANVGSWARARLLRLLVEALRCIAEHRPAHLRDQRPRAGVKAVEKVLVVRPVAGKVVHEALAPMTVNRTHAPPRGGPGGHSEGVAVGGGVALKVRAIRVVAANATALRRARRFGDGGGPLGRDVGTRLVADVVLAGRVLHPEEPVAIGACRIRDCHPSGVVVGAVDLVQRRLHVDHVDRAPRR